MSILKRISRFPEHSVNDLRRLSEYRYRQHRSGSRMARQCMSECITDIVRSVGRMVGFRLAAGLVSEPLERTGAMYREVKDVRISGESIKIVLDEKVSDKRLEEIFMAFLTGMDSEYSRVIGRVSRTIIRKSLESCAKKHGQECPVIRKLPGRF
jgi:hypothetical protein